MIQHSWLCGTRPVLNAVCFQLDLNIAIHYTVVCNTLFIVVRSSEIALLPIEGGTLWLHSPLLVSNEWLPTSPF